MVEYDQFKYTLSQYETPLQELRSALALDQKKEQISELSMYMEDPNFWNDAEKSAEITKKLKNLQDTVKEFDEIEKLYDDMNSIIEIAEEMEDGSLVDDVQADMDSFKEKFEELLKEKHFLRISKSMLLNLMKVSAIKPALNSRFTAQLQSGEQVVISRKYVPELRKALKGEKTK